MIVSDRQYLFCSLFYSYLHFYTGVRQLAMPVMGGAGFVVVDSGNTKTPFLFLMDISYIICSFYHFIR